ncbi:MAG TPA: hypothetical protein VGQ18_04605 [Gemmatimonadales bacterium]|jgi:hypothetical protein|nr:hypothetical protein [Gemmatimonadales bacterium]
MKRIVFALALVAMASAACKKADQAQMAADTTHTMAADSTKMAGDTTHMQMAPDSAKKH